MFGASRCGEVYSKRGGRVNSMSVLETIRAPEAAGHKLEWRYEEKDRVGDHIVLSRTSQSCVSMSQPGMKYNLKRVLERLLASAQELLSRERVSTA